MAPLVLSAERISGGRWLTVVSVRPGVRVAVISDGPVDLAAHQLLLTSQIIPALERGLAVPRQGGT